MRNKSPSVNIIKNYKQPRPVSEMVDQANYRHNYQNSKNSVPLTSENILQTLNGVSIQQLSIQMLERKGFIAKENDQNLITIDISSLLRERRESIFLDGSVDVVRVEENTNKERLLQVVSQNYHNNIKSLEAMLKMIDVEWQKTPPNVRNLNEKICKLQHQLMYLKEVNEILETELRKQRTQIEMEKVEWRSKVDKFKKELAFQKKNHQETKDLLQDLKKAYDQLQAKQMRLQSALQQTKSSASECEKKLIRTETIPEDSVWLQFRNENPEQNSMKKVGKGGLKMNKFVSLCDKNDSTVSSNNLFSSVNLKSKDSRQLTDHLGGDNKTISNSYCEKMTEI